MNKKAFTLVELIVVITILTILGTIAFISLQGYSKTTRDSVRISDLSNISKAMKLMVIQGAKLPIPDNKIDVTASGKLISYQGYVGKEVLSKIGIYNGGKDPLDDTYYIYAVNPKLSKYQILGFLEENNSTSMINYKVYAGTELRYPLLKGEELGIIFDGITNKPIQELGSNVDIITTNIEQKIYLNSTNILSGTGGVTLAMMIPNTNCKRIKDFNPKSENGIYIINPDGKEVEKYCFMDYIGDGSLIMNITGDNGMPNDIMGNMSYNLNNFKIQSEYSKNLKGLYGQRDTSSLGTLVESGASGISYTDISGVGNNLNEVTSCEWVLSLQTTTPAHTLVSYYYDDGSLIFRFGNRASSTSIGGGSYQFIPNSVSLFSSIVVNEGVWNHFCDVFDGKNYLKYHNGELKEISSTILSSSYIPFSFKYGSIFLSTDIYSKDRLSVDEMMLFNKALSSKEIKNIYDIQK